MTHNKLIGMRGEELAAEFLENLGYRIIARNFHVSHDEFDIIAENDKYIVFAEVKARAVTEANKRFGRPCMAVDFRKQQKLLRAAEEYLRRFDPQKKPRIDVIEVYFPPVHPNAPISIEELPAVDIKHLRNAVHY